MLKKILNHSLWLFVGSSVGRLTMFMTNIVAARMLPQEVFGQFTIIRNTISSIEGILSGALASPMIKRVSETAEDRDKVNLVVSALLLTNISIAILLAVAVYFLSPLIVKSFFIDRNELIHGLTIGAFLLIATTLSNLMQTILIGLEEFKKLAFAGVAASLFSLPLIVILTINFDFYGVIWGIVIYFLSDFGWKYVQLRKKITLSFINGIRLMGSEGGALLKRSIPLFFSVVISTISFWYARIMVVQVTNSFTEIAIFDAAFQWLTIIMTITAATTNVVLPMLSKTSDENDIKKIFIINCIVNVLISVFIALIFIIFSKEIMSIYGPSYVQGYSTLIVLAIASIFFTLAVVFNRYMVARERNWMIFFTTISSGLVLLIYLNFSNDLNSCTMAKSVFLYYLSSTIIYLVFFRERNTNSA